MMNMEKLVLVNELDKSIGVMEKMEAHRKGLLHRAFSIFIFNSKGQLLLQQRALEKYHSGGLWTNACCGHPRPEEEIEQAALRRLREEMGLQCALKFSFSFIYRFDFENGLSEHEYDHVFTGVCDDKPVVNPAEAMSWKYLDQDKLRASLKKEPEKYTHWFGLALERVIHEHRIRTLKMTVL
jgi:isopentenyl-diphosphate Delta-isomerase